VFGRYALERGPFDVIHLWGGKLASLEPWRARVVMLTDVRRGELRRAGKRSGTNEKVWTLPLVAIGEDAAPALLSERERRRRELSLLPNDVAMVLLADPPDHGQVARFTFLTTLLRVSGIRVVAVVDAHGREAARGLSARRTGLMEREPILFNGPIEGILAACDVGVCSPGSRFTRDVDDATWSEASLARMALDLGVAVTSASEGLVPPEFQASMVPHSPHPAAIARVVARLCEGAGGLATVRRMVLESRGTAAADEIAKVVEGAWTESLA
jgi:hypothetical protein